LLLVQPDVVVLAVLVPRVPTVWAVVWAWAAMGTSSAAQTAAASRALRWVMKFSREEKGVPRKRSGELRGAQTGRRGLQKIFQR
jgi:hypothetical protein